MIKYCVMPFVSVRIEDSQNESSMRVRPCCYYKPEHPVNFSSINEYLESDMLKNLQQHLLMQDKLPPGCAACEFTEQQNQPSVRQLKNRYFNNLSLDQTKIQELDIFPSNTCNLSCVMCSPKFSSSIGLEQKKLGIIEQIYNFDETDFVLESIELLPDLKYIVLAGGEFFYSKHATKILKAIQQAGIPNIKIITNATVCNSEHVEILKTFDYVNLRISVDGIDNVYELVRYPAKWQEVSKNIVHFRDALSNAHVEIVMVLQPLNVFDIFNFVEFGNEFGIETHWQLIHGDMAWHVLTDNERKIAADFLLEGCGRTALDTRQRLWIMNYARSILPSYKFDPTARDRFIDKLVQLHQIRNMDSKTIAQICQPWPELQQSILSRLQ